LDLLNDVLRKFDWYSDFLREENAEPLDFIGRFTLKSKIEEVAEDICNTLAIDESFRLKAKSWEDFLRRFIDSAQERRILVLRSGIVGGNTHRKLSVAEFRGFTISDKFAPIIYINGSDAKAAQIFTLAHELAHLWLGESGISNLDISQPSINQKREIELFCNRVAAELLVPEKSFLNSWADRISLEDNLNKLTREYRVSSLVILRRALDLKKIKPDKYNDCYREVLEKLNKKRSDEEGRGDFYATFLTRNSRILTTSLLSRVFEGKAMYREASQLLGVRTMTLRSIAARFGIR